jgi:hypothetical protein
MTAMKWDEVDIPASATGGNIALIIPTQGASPSGGTLCFGHVIPTEGAAVECPHEKLGGVAALDYWMELATLEKTVLELLPISRTVPTTITRITASITAYSAISWPSSSNHKFRRYSLMLPPFNLSAFKKVS